MKGEEEDNLSGTDILICNLKLQPDYNGVGARCLKYHPAKDRYSVRIHFGQDVAAQETKY